MIFLFTDFGAHDIYVGQVKAVLAQQSPGVPVIDLLHDAEAFAVEPAAHVLAALVQGLPPNSTVVAVVDPGVGSKRVPVAVQADGRFIVGPDNGLISVVAARARNVTVREILWRPDRLSDSFHGRDLFAPVAAALATDRLSEGHLAPPADLQVNLGPHDHPAVIYLDHYGNLMTGLRAPSPCPSRRLHIAGNRIPHAHTFSSVPAGALFWYVNSIGLVEIAANRASAAGQLRISIGEAVAWESP